MTTPTIDYAAMEAKLACLAPTYDSAELKALMEALKDSNISPGERASLRALVFHLLYGGTVPGLFSPIATDSQSQQP